jgi:hypothetical protein
MHDIEAGHTCPKCSSRSICTIEDGSCENGGKCDDCIKDAEYDRMNRWDYDPDHDD